MTWKLIETAPEGKIVNTCIMDENNIIRNEALLKRQNKLWFFPDMSMYIYYKPTHWIEV